jgi:hypothetical protein
MSRSENVTSIACWLPVAALALGLMGCQTVDPTGSSRPLGIFSAPQAATNWPHEARRSRQVRTPEAAPRSVSRRSPTVAGLGAQPSGRPAPLSSQQRGIGVLVGVGF